MKRDYYEVLGVARDVDAAELKRTYRELALRFHPDKNQGNKEAEEQFKEVSEAYAVLSDVEKRARYDRVGHAGMGGGTGGFGAEDFGLGGFQDLFENLFGDLLGRKKQRQVGRDLRYTLELSFSEAALGCERSIKFPARRDCEDCGGTGAKGGASGLDVCADCAGKGELRVQQGFFTIGKSCSRCSGTGRIVKDPCTGCKGAGLVDKEREYAVVVPSASEDGQVRRVAGQGEPGRRGGQPGDLHVVLRVKPHPVFVREGAVIVCEIPVSMTHAALGGLIDVPTLDGKVEMRIPAGAQSGAVFRLRGKGMPTGPKGSARGDQHVKVVVETPQALTPRQRELIEQLQVEMGEENSPRQRDFAAKLKDLGG